MALLWVFLLPNYICAVLKSQNLSFKPVLGLGFLECEFGLDFDKRPPETPSEIKEMNIKMQIGDLSRIIRGELRFLLSFPPKLFRCTRYFSLNKKTRPQTFATSLFHAISQDRFIFRIRKCIVAELEQIPIVVHDGNEGID